MLTYCVTKKGLGELRLAYLGTSIKDAEESVGDFVKYQKDETQFPVNFRSLYTLIPEILEPKMIQYYMYDGQWYSIVMFELKETNNGS